MSNHTPARLSRAAGIAGLVLAAAYAAAEDGPSLTLDNVLLEAAHLSDAPDARSLLNLRAEPAAKWHLGDDWELRVGVRLDAVRQSGGSAAYSKGSVEANDIFVRWQSGDTRLTAGWQTILWGRVDEIPLIDRISRVDASRLLLDDLPQRRLSLPALRWEQSFDTLTLDAVVLPAFDGAKLAQPRSIWHPVDQRRGMILGSELPALLSAFVSGATLKEDEHGSGGAALRLARTGAGAFDWGLTAARVRQSLPYYVPDPLAGTLTATHPYTRFLGADAEMTALDATWRTELGVTWDSPATSTAGQALRGRAVDWVGAVEFFPGGEDLRVNLQLAARDLDIAEKTLELRRYVALGGEVETTLDQGRWKLALRFNRGLNVNDVYVAPRVTYAGIEPHQFYVSYHHFGGEARTLGGFHRDHGMLAVGLRTRF